MGYLLFYLPVFLLFSICSLVLIRAGIQITGRRRLTMIGLATALYVVSAIIIAAFLYSGEDLQGESSLSIFSGVLQLGLSGAALGSPSLLLLYSYTLLIEKWTRSRPSPKV